jgi:hypothetical protein
VIKRRGFRFRDPTVERAQLSKIDNLLNAITDPVEKELFLHVAALGLPFPESARRLGLTRKDARQLAERTRDKINDPSYGGILWGEALDDSYVLRSAELRAWTTQALTSLQVVCPRCSHRFLPESLFDPSGGRPRTYCSNACRQAAYRARRRASTDEPTGGAASPGDPTADGAE